MTPDQHSALVSVLEKHAAGLQATLRTNQATLDNKLNQAHMSIASRQSQDHDGILHRLNALDERLDQLRIQTRDQSTVTIGPKPSTNTTALTTVLLHVQSAMARALQQALTTDKTAQRTETCLADVTAQLIMIRACISHFDMTISTFDDRLAVMEANQFARDESLQADDDDASTTHKTTPKRVPPTPQNGPGQAAPLV